MGRKHSLIANLLTVVQPLSGIKKNILTVYIYYQGNQRLKCLWIQMSHSGDLSCCSVMYHL